MKKLKCVLLSERSQSEKTSCCTIPIIQPPEKGKTMETVKESVVARSWEAGRVEYKQNFRSTKPFCMIVSCSRPMTFYISQNSLNEPHQELVQFSSFQLLSCVWLFATNELQHTRPPCPSPTPGVHPNPRPLGGWCHPTISSSVVSFSSCPQSFPASGSFPVSQLFASGGQSIGVSASTSVLPMNTQDWSPLGWTGWISLQSKGLSRVFSNTTVKKHQFFGTQLSSQSNSHIHTWPLEKP